MSAWSNQTCPSKNMVPKQRVLLSKRINSIFHVGLCGFKVLRLYCGVVVLGLPSLAARQIHSFLGPLKDIEPYPPKFIKDVFCYVFFPDGYRSKGRNGNALDFLFFFENLSAFARVETADRSSYDCFPTAEDVGSQYVSSMQSYISTVHNIYFAVRLIICLSLML